MSLLRECLASLAIQYVPEGASAIEWIVVDNGSTDGSAAMVAADFPRARLIRNSENRGFCAANNQGIDCAQGRYIALLNNDAVVSGGWLAALIAEMETSPLVGMVASKILVYERSHVIDKAGHLIYWDGQNRGRGSGQVDRGQYDNERDILWPDGCAALYRRAMLDEIGGFDEDFFAYADDAELGLRARSMGWLARFAPDAEVLHHRGATMGKKNPRRLELIERNRLWLVWKHFPLWLVLLNPVFFAMRIGHGAIAGLRGRGEAGQFGGIRAKISLGITLIEANIEALRGLPAIWRKRREWRGRRKWTDSDVVALLRRHRISLRELSEDVA